MQTGLDRLIRENSQKLKGKKIGLLIHPASINKQYRHCLDLLLESQFHITALFGPEHGIRGEAQDMEGVSDLKDPVSGLPVFSLYGNNENSLKPKSDYFNNIEVLIIDLQDIGARYYTFIYSMAFCMELAAQKGIRVIVLDRPNPINGKNMEGNLIRPGFESFVGAYSIPNRHGMTIGELALYFNEEENIHCELEIISMKKWNRNRYYDELDYPWVLPSPNMPSCEAALVYPGMCLIEATEISEARGTTKPFEFFGAPFIDPEKLVQRLRDFRLPSVKFRPIYFKPMFQKCASQVCGGAQIHVTRRKSFLPLLTGVAILKAIYELYPNDFQWREKPYEFVKDIPAIDLLMGGDDFRKGLEKGISLAEHQALWTNDLISFQEKRRPYLLY